jgi:MFS family permease
MDEPTNPDRAPLVRPARAEPKGLRTFLTVWLGQAVSIFGSGLSTFALGVWAYESTGSATAFALVTFFGSLPTVLVTPFAGVVVDRWDRRYAMMVGDGAAALVSALILVLVWKDSLEVWHLYLLATLNASFNTLYHPAFTAVTPLLVPKKHLGRAAGLTQVAIAAPQVAAPLAAGTLMAILHLEGILILDMVAASFAIGTLMVVRFPPPPESAEGKAAAKAPFRQQMTVGWDFIRPRRGLLALLILFACINFIGGMMYVLITPLVLSFADARVLGLVVSTSGVGYLLGGLVMGAWGGPKRRVPAILVVQMIKGVLLVAAGLRADPWLIACIAFFYMFTTPILVGCSQAIWQVKVPPDLMGRVFAVRGLVAWSTLPLAYLLAGPLADHVFEPLMAEGGSLAASVGSVIGVGPGRGIGLQLMLLGILLLIIVAVAAGRPILRNLETDLPDFIGDEPVGDEPEVGDEPAAVSPSLPSGPGAADVAPRPNPGAP